MLFGIVKGTAVCTQKYSGLEGIKLLIVQPVSKELEPIGGLKIAADVLNLSQSAVSSQIKALEDELGLRLFKRSSRGMTLTHQGEALLPHVHEVLEAADAQSLTETYHHLRKLETLMRLNEENR